MESVFFFENFHQWSFLIQNRLRGRGLWEIVVNGIPPKPLANSESAQNLSYQELRLWKSMESKNKDALNILQANLPYPLYSLTRLALSAKEAWKILNDAHTKFREFQEIKMQPGSSILLYVDKIAKLGQEIKTFGVLLSEKDIINKIFATLPDRYASVSQEIMNGASFESVEDLRAIVASYCNSPSLHYNM